MMKRLHEKIQESYVIMTYQRAIRTCLIAEQKSIMKAFRNNYKNLLKERSTYSKKILNWHLFRNILPGIALNQALEQEGRSKTETVRDMAQLYLVLYGNTARIYSAIGHVPGFFSLLRYMSARSMKVTYPADGWVTTWIENSPDRIAFDVHSCFYQKILREYGCEHILKCFCKIDDDMYQAMSPVVEWGRTTTLGRCGAVCNFRYTKKVGLRKQSKIKEKSNHD